MNSPELRLLIFCPFSATFTENSFIVVGVREAWSVVKFIQSKKNGQLSIKIDDFYYFCWKMMFFFSNIRNKVDDLLQWMIWEFAVVWDFLSTPCISVVLESRGGEDADRFDIFLGFFVFLFATHSSPLLRLSNVLENPLPLSFSLSRSLCLFFFPRSRSISIVAL